MSDTTDTTSTDDAANAAALADALAGIGTDDTGTGTTDADTDTSATDTTDTGTGDTAAQPDVAELAAQIEALKAESRKWEDRSKKNYTELERIKRDGMTDEERATADAAAVSEAVTTATERAEKAEAALLRKTIAVDLSLSKEHAAVLDGINGDETALRAVAAALAAAKPEAKPEKKGVVPSQGAAAGGTGKLTLGEQFEVALDGIL